GATDTGLMPGTRPLVNSTSCFHGTSLILSEQSHTIGKSMIPTPPSASITVNVINI
ncbi:hypothetical protein A2U01_0058308, partial [Trifolium medium]|nr:hypothetical protein [Trifolium medium]